MFAATARTHTEGLSNDERERFEAWGWLGPFPLLTSEGVDALSEAFTATGERFSWKNLRASCEQNDFDTHPWFKSLHAYLPAFGEVACQPAIVERIASLLGPNLMAWGVSVTTRHPGQVHRWHVDVEHLKWPGISAFIGLKNASSNSSLTVIPGSHHFSSTPQALGAHSNSEVLVAGRTYDPNCHLETIDINDGEFFIFHGRLWHGSHNIGRKTRTAVIAQYSTPQAEVAIPMGWDEPITWHSYRPPCLLVKGTDTSDINRTLNRATTQTPGIKP